ncbi:tetratricopeptide repeat protein [Rubritalea marina]|uniref:tetratricopeptide repeat protein n=1 Tax=Rubritalea marina TaxID=361055 RepID=UPI0003795682|nr:tetratricopeptide repeat protein [Rubritalea marina]
MKKKTLGLLILGGIAALCAIVLVVSIKVDPTPENETTAGSKQTAAEGILALTRAGAYSQAYQQALLALENDPNQGKVALQAGHLAVVLKKPDQAADHMQQAWDLGERKLSAILVIVDDLEGSRSEKIALFNKLFAHLEQTPRHLNAKARFYSQIGEHEEALLIWKALHESNPAEGLVLQIARKLEMTGKREKAIAFLYEQEALGHLSDEGMNMLVSLMIFDNQVEDALEKANAYEAEDPHGEWQLKMAMLQILGGDLPEALATLESLKDADSEHPIAITVSHEARIFLALLRVIIQQNEASFSDLHQIANAELKHVPPGTLPTPLLGLRVSQKQIEGERIFYQFLGESLSAGSNSNYARISSLIGDSPVLKWLGIRYFLTEGKAADAVALYQSLESIHPLARIEGLAGCFYKSPLFLLEVARAYELNGQASQALAILAHLHQRGAFTPDSILLYSKVGVAANDSYDVQNVERVLNERFKNDLSFQLRKIGKALENNNDAQALEQIRPIALANPENLELQMIYYMALVSQNREDELRRELGKSQVPERSKHLILARLELKKGNAAKAEQLFMKAMDEDDLHGYLDYARFLVIEKRTGQAQELYRAVLESNPENVTALHGLAIIHELNGETEEAIATLRQAADIDSNSAYTFNRLAKLYLQSSKASDALWEVERVLNQNPEDVDAIALKVVAMTQLAMEQTIETLQKSKLDEAQRYLSKVISQTPENPQLGLQLYVAAAYRDHGYMEEAATIYQNILDLDSAFWESSPIKRGDIEVALQTIHE